MIPDIPLSAVLAPISGLISALAALAGVMLSNRLGRAAQVQNRIWEKRTEAYGQIDAALKACIVFGEQVQEAYSEDPHRADVDASTQARRGKMWKHYGCATKAYRASSLLLSDDFAATMDELEAKLGFVGSIGDPDDPPQQHQKALTLIREASANLRSQAKREINR